MSLDVPLLFVNNTSLHKKSLIFITVYTISWLQNKWKHKNIIFSKSLMKIKIQTNDIWDSKIYIRSKCWTNRENFIHPKHLNFLMENTV